MRINRGQFSFFLLCLGFLLARSTACDAAAQDVGTLIGWGGYVENRELHSPTPLTNAVKLAQRNCLVLTDTGRVFSPGTPPLSELTNIAAVASGDEHAVALTSNGVMLRWAYDPQGQQGPVEVFASNIIAIAAGGSHSLALTEDRRVLSWGGGTVPANLTNVQAIAAGQLHSLAVKGDGTVVAWGDNRFDQCSVPLGLTGVVMVAGGHTHSLALKNDGTVVGWGAGSGNDEGQTRTPPDATNVTAIAAGGHHSLALRADGRIVGWGWNGFGQLEIPSDSSFFGVAAGLITSFGLTRVPVVTVQPLSQSVRAGTNVSMLVEAVGTYPWEYQWVRDGTNLAGATSPNLQLADVQVEHSGQYSVILSNSFGSRMTSPVSLNVQAYPPALTMQPTNQQRLAGGTAVLAVQASGAPPLFYQWFFNDSVLETATSATLILTNVVEANEGRYKVEVRNRYGTNASATATLTVNYPPTITNQATSLELYAGTNWILRAFAEGNPPIRYQWQFQGSNIVAATNASMVLSNIQAGHAGTYSLVASNAFGVVTNVLYHVVVEDSAPVIYAQPVSQAFRPGDTIRLRVLAYGSEPLRWQWRHNGNAIVGATNNVLMLTNTLASHVGIYDVTITNHLGGVRSSPATIEIGDPFPGQIDWPISSFVAISSVGFPSPTVITHAGDGSERLFIVEQSGRIRIIQTNTILSVPLLDITDRVLSGGERGLLGLAFPAGFSTNRHFYVNYTRRPDGATVVSRFSVGTDPNMALTNSEQVLMTIAQPFANHNGGQLAFGPGGYLYIGTGDGGFASQSNPDPATNAQNTLSLLGKLLRIDVESGVSPYTIPASNPFASNTNYAPEIWALGLRNPWRFSFDRLTGDLFIGDVGHNRYEEINYQPGNSVGGQNYGWRFREGPAAFIQPNGYDTSGLTEPVTWYDRSVGASVTGGFVYRGSKENRMRGAYFFGDFTSGRIWGLKQIGTNWHRSEITNTTFTISTFGEDETGELYLANYFDGRIYQIRDTRQAARPVFSATGTVNSNTVIVSSPTPGVIIHYTTDGRDPTEFDLGVTSGSTITVESGTVKLRTFRGDLTPSEVVNGVFTLKVGTPNFAPAQGPVTNGTLLTITTGTPDAIIRYTLNGTPPGTNSFTYTGPFALTGNVTVTARAYRPGFSDSDVLQQFFELALVSSPVFSPSTGPITNGTPVAIACDTPGAVIRYTIDGSEPDATSGLYAGPVVLNGNTTLKARAFRDAFAPSPIASQFYELVRVAEPEFSPTGGPITNGTLVTITCTTPNATIRYTLDGTEPTASSPVYAGGLQLNGNTTLSARGFKAAFNDSFVRSNHYHLVNYERTVVWTLAGTGEVGAQDGPALSAQFNAPEGLWLDHNSGELYVADTGNHKIRKVLPSGIVTSVAGTGAPGFVEGISTNAQFDAPSGVCRDASGNLFIADRNNAHRIRKMATDGVVSTFAMVRPSYTGPGLSQIEVDRAGNLYVGNWALVTRVSTSGEVTHIAGSENSGEIYGWSALVGIGVDAATNVFATTLNKVVKVTPQGIAETYAGDSAGFGDGTRMQSLFELPRDATVDSNGNVFISEAKRIRKINSGGTVTTYAGSGTVGFRNGQGAQAQFNLPLGLCVDAIGNVYVADSLNHRIRVVSLDTDADGIPDFKEGSSTVFVIGTDDRLTDNDNDGMSNAAEFHAGTNPQNASSYLGIDSITVMSNGLAQITWQSVAGKRYVVKYTDDFSSWSTLGQASLGDGFLLVATDPIVPGHRRIYRVFLAD